MTRDFVIDRRAAGGLLSTLLGDRWRRTVLDSWLIRDKGGCGWLFTTREDARLIARRSICAPTRRLGRGPAGLWPSAAEASYSQSKMWRSGWARSCGSTTTSHCIQLCRGLYAPD